MSEEREEYVIGQSDLSYKDEDLLSLTEVAKQSGWDYEKLRSYLRDCPDLNTYVKAGKKKGSKGLGYPPDSIPFFERMLAEVNAGKIVPTTLAGWLSGLSQELIGESFPLAVSGRPHSAVSPQNVIIPVEVLTRLIQAIERQAEAFKALPPPPAAPDDCLLTMKAAHEETGVPYSDLRDMRVTVGKRKFVRRSDCLRFIQNLSD